MEPVRVRSLKRICNKSENFSKLLRLWPFGAVDTASYGEIRAALERRATEDYKHAVIGPSGRVALVVPSRVKGVEKPCQGQLS